MWKSEKRWYFSLKKKIKYQLLKGVNIGKISCKFPLNITNVFFSNILILFSWHGFYTLVVHSYFSYLCSVQYLSAFVPKISRLNCSCFFLNFYNNPHVTSRLCPFLLGYFNCLYFPCEKSSFQLLQCWLHCFVHFRILMDVFQINKWANN